MGVKITGRLLQKKSMEFVHEPSGTRIITDAPVDNNGEGKSFSPTDLLTTSLGSCMLTVMAIVAERDGLSLEGMHVELEKNMSQNPRRVGHIPLTIHLPAALTPEQRKKMENTANTCPVKHSLHPDLKIEISFLYDV